jgi:hypothetical protein
MDEKTSTWIDLVKYPVLVLTILICAIIAKYALKLEFGVVTELGTTGVKFAEKSRETGAALADLSGKISAISVELDQIKKQMQTQSPHLVMNDDAAFDAAQTVPDQIAKTAMALPIPREGNAKIESAPKGCIWIGNYKDGWKINKLADSKSGQPITIPPEAIQPGSVFMVMGNMVVREGMPENNPSYFKGKASIGVLSRGTLVRIISAPKAIDRQFTIQYWAEVEQVLDSRPE